MKKLFLFSLLSLYSGIFAINCDVTIEVNNRHIHQEVTFDDHYPYPYHFQNDSFKMVARLEKETDDSVEIHFELFDKNENGEFELIASPCIKADFGKTAKLKMKNRHKSTGQEHSFVMQMLTTK